MESETDKAGDEKAVEEKPSLLSTFTFIQNTPLLDSSIRVPTLLKRLKSLG